MKTRTPPNLVAASPNALVQVFHHRWALPVMAELHRDQGAKFVTLLNRLGVGRDTLSRTLKALIGDGWVKRNPGHGHPLRPEYILTPTGRALGQPSVALYDLLVATENTEIGLKKWSMPVLFALDDAPRRFSHVAAALPAATPRALTQSLKALTQVELVERTLLDEYPPRSLYAATPHAAELQSWSHRLAHALGQR